LEGRRRCTLAAWKASDGARVGAVEPKLPNGSFETPTRYMTRQLGRLEKVGKEALVKPSSLEGLRSWGGVGPSRTRTGSSRPRKDLSEGWRR